MVSKRNFKNCFSELGNKYSLRKTTLGVGSVFIGAFLLGVNGVSAEEVDFNSSSVPSTPEEPVFDGFEVTENVDFNSSNSFDVFDSDYSFIETGYLESLEPVEANSTRFTADPVSPDSSVTFDIIRTDSGKEGVLDEWSGSSLNFNMRMSVEGIDKTYDGLTLRIDYDREDSGVNVATYNFSGYNNKLPDKAGDSVTYDNLGSIVSGNTIEIPMVVDLRGVIKDRSRTSFKATLTDGSGVVLGSKVVDITAKSLKLPKFKVVMVDKGDSTKYKNGDKNSPYSGVWSDPSNTAMERYEHEYRLEFDTDNFDVGYGVNLEQYKELLRNNLGLSEYYDNKLTLISDNPNLELSIVGNDRVDIESLLGSYFKSSGRDGELPFIYKGKYKNTKDRSENFTVVKLNITGESISYAGDTTAQPYVMDSSALRLKYPWKISTERYVVSSGEIKFSKGFTSLSSLGKGVEGYTIEGDSYGVYNTSSYENPILEFAGIGVTDNGNSHLIVNDADGSWVGFSYETSNVYLKKGTADDPKDNTEAINYSRTKWGNVKNGSSSQEDSWGLRTFIALPNSQGYRDVSGSLSKFEDVYLTLNSNSQGFRTTDIDIANSPNLHKMLTGITFDNREVSFEASDFEVVSTNAKPYIINPKFNGTDLDAYYKGVDTGKASPFVDIIKFTDSGLRKLKGLVGIDVNPAKAFDFDSFLTGNDSSDGFETPRVGLHGRGLVPRIVGNDIRYFGSLRESFTVGNDGDGVDDYPAHLRGVDPTNSSVGNYGESVMVNGLVGDSTNFSIVNKVVVTPTLNYKHSSLLDKDVFFLTHFPRTSYRNDGSAVLGSLDSIDESTLDYYIAVPNGVDVRTVRNRPNDIEIVFDKEIDGFKVYKLNGVPPLNSAKFDESLYITPRVSSIPNNMVGDSYKLPILTFVTSGNPKLLVSDFGKNDENLVEVNTFFTPKVMKQITDFNKDGDDSSVISSSDDFGNGDTTHGFAVSYITVTPPKQLSIYNENKTSREDFSLDTNSLIAGEDSPVRTTIFNQSPTSYTDIKVITTLPKLNDKKISNQNTSRDSKFDTYLKEAVTAPQGWRVEYTTSDLSGGATKVTNWVSSPPSNLRDVTAIRYVSNPGVRLGGGERLNFDIKLTTPQDAPSGSKYVSTSAISVNGSDTYLEGYRTTATVVPLNVTGKVYLDKNDTGGYEAVSDDPKRNVTVQLVDERGDVVQLNGRNVETTTDSDGNYSLGVPYSRRYKVKVVPPKGLTAKNGDVSSEFTLNIDERTTVRDFPLIEREETGSVIVKYEDENGNKIKEPVTLMPDTTAVGTQYNAQPKREATINFQTFDYNYLKLKTGSDKESSTVENREMVVTYVYRVQPKVSTQEQKGTVKVRYETPDGVTLKPEHILINDQLVNTVRTETRPNVNDVVTNVPTNITYDARVSSVKPPTLSQGNFTYNYSRVKDGSPLTGKVAVGEKIITLIYEVAPKNNEERQYGTVKVKYIDAKGNVIKDENVVINNQLVNTRTTTTTPAGSQTSDNPTNITYDVSTVGIKLATIEKDTFTYNFKNQQGTEPLTGKVPVGERVVTFVYDVVPKSATVEERGTVTVNYVDTTGRVIKPKFVHKNNELVNTVTTKTYPANYNQAPEVTDAPTNATYDTTVGTIKHATIDFENFTYGFQKQKDNDPVPKGKLNKGITEITYVYEVVPKVKEEQQKGTVIVRYEDRHGNKIKDEVIVINDQLVNTKTTTTTSAGDQVSNTPTNITYDVTGDTIKIPTFQHGGFKYNFLNEKNNKPLTGKVAVGETIITFVYDYETKTRVEEEKGTVIIAYVDTLGNVIKEEKTIINDQVVNRRTTVSDVFNSDQVTNAPTGIKYDATTDENKPNEIQHATNGFSYSFVKQKDNDPSPKGDVPVGLTKITYVYEAIPKVTTTQQKGSVRVNYVDEAGNKIKEPVIVVDDVVVLTTNVSEFPNKPKETSTVVSQAAYDTTTPDIKLAEIEHDTFTYRVLRQKFNDPKPSGKVTEGILDITYVYKVVPKEEDVEKRGTVKVYYEDTDGNTLKEHVVVKDNVLVNTVNTKTYPSPKAPVITNNPTNESYDVSTNTYKLDRFQSEGYDFELVGLKQGSPAETGIVKEGETNITFTYRVIPKESTEEKRGKITIKYATEEGVSVKDDRVLVDNELVSTTITRTRPNKPDEVITNPTNVTYDSTPYGDEFLEKDGVRYKKINVVGDETGKVKDGEHIIKYIYKRWMPVVEETKQTGTIKVRYVERGTNKELLGEEVALSDELVNTHRKTTAPEGTVTEEDFPTNYEYDVNSFKHPYVMSGEKRYVWVSEDKPLLGTLKAGETVITIYYVENSNGVIETSENGTVVVKYVNEKGDSIKEPVKLIDNEVVNGVSTETFKDGSEDVVTKVPTNIEYDATVHRMNEVEFGGFTYRLTPRVSGTERGKVPVGVTEVIYHYEVVPKVDESYENGTLTVYFKDSDGNDLVSPKVIYENEPILKKTTTTTPDGVDNVVEELEKPYDVSSDGEGDLTIGGKVYRRIDRQDGLSKGKLKSGENEVVFYYEEVKEEPKEEPKKPEPPKEEPEVEPKEEPKEEPKKPEPPKEEPKKPEPPKDKPKEEPKDEGEPTVPPKKPEPPKEVIKDEPKKPVNEPKKPEPSKETPKEELKGVPKDSGEREVSPEVSNTGELPQTGETELGIFTPAVISLLSSVGLITVKKRKDEE